jgi:hypothetical protein
MVKKGATAVTAAATNTSPNSFLRVRDHTPVALLWCLALMGMGRNILGGTYRPGKRFRLFGFGMKPTILRGPEIVNVVIVICCC